MSGRHCAGRHAARADDWPVPLADLIRDTGGLPAARTLPEVPAALHPERWATPPGTFDDEVLHTVRLGEVHAEPPTWGGRGVRL